MLVESGALMFGEFRLTSGKKSSYYINIKKAYTEPVVLKGIAREMARHVKAHRVAGMELGAIPIVVAVALETGKPFSMIRKEGREHGTGKLIEGDIQGGETVDIIEDVSTTGGSIIKSAHAVRQAGGSVERAIVVVDRGEGAENLLRAEGIELVSLVSAEQLRTRAN